VTVAIHLPKILLLVTFLVLALADRALGVGRLPELAIGERIAAASDGRQAARLGLLEERRWKELEQLRHDVEASQRVLEDRIVGAVRSGIVSSTAPLAQRLDQLTSDHRRLVAGTIVGLVAVAILSYRIGRLTPPTTAQTASAALIELAALQSAVTRLRDTQPVSDAPSRVPLRKAG